MSMKSIHDRRYVMVDVRSLKEIVSNVVKSGTLKIRRTKVRRKVVGIRRRRKELLSSRCVCSSGREVCNRGVRVARFPCVHSLPRAFHFYGTHRRTRRLKTRCSGNGRTQQRGRNRERKRAGVVGSPYGRWKGGRGV